jgi:O-antigen ligase
MKIQLTQFITQWINFWVFVFCVGIIGLGRGGEAGIVLLFTMVCIFSIGFDKVTKYELNRDEKIFVTLVILYFLLNAFNTIFQPEGLEFEDARAALRSMDKPFRWILMLPLFFLFRRYRLDWKVISIGICIGVFITVSFAINQVYFLGISRASGGMNHIISFGEFMVVVDLILLMLMIYAWDQNKKLLSIMLLIASLVAFYGSLLAITRGAWLAYIVLIVIFLIYSLKIVKSNLKLFINKPMIFRLALSFCILFFVSQTDQFNHIKNRTVNSVNDAYQGQYDKASGNRLVLFKSALKVNQNYPFGVGPDNFRAGVKSSIIIDALDVENVIVTEQNKNKLDIEEILDLYKNPNLHSQYPYLFLESFNEDGSLKYSSKYKHAHNEWLNVLAENGFAGIILLTLLFIMPLKIFWINFDNANKLVRTYSHCGILFIICFIIFGQTQSIFSSNDVLIFFIFFVFLFIGQISRLINTDKHSIVY